MTSIYHLAHGTPLQAPMWVDYLRILQTLEAQEVVSLQKVCRLKTLEFSKQKIICLIHY